MKDFQGFDASQDAEALYNAMKGFGMDAPPGCDRATLGVPYSLVSPIPWLTLAWLGVLHHFPSQLTDCFSSVLKLSWFPFLPGASLALLVLPAPPPEQLWAQQGGCGDSWLSPQAVTKRPSSTSSHPEATGSGWRSAKPTSPSMGR